MLLKVRMRSLSMLNVPSPGCSVDFLIFVWNKILSHDELILCTLVLVSRRLKTCTKLLQNVQNCYMYLSQGDNFDKLTPERHLVLGSLEAYGCVLNRAAFNCPWLSGLSDCDSLTLNLTHKLNTSPGTNLEQLKPVESAEARNLLSKQDALEPERSNTHFAVLVFRCVSQTMPCWAVPCLKLCRGCVKAKWTIEVFVVGHLLLGCTLRRGVHAQRHCWMCILYWFLQSFLLLYKVALGGWGGGTTDVTDGTGGWMLTFHVTCSRCWCSATLGWGGC